MNYIRPAVIGLLALAALLVSVSPGHGAHINPTVIATIPVGSFPEDVGVNPTTNRVYVSKAGDATVSVIDGASNAVIATVPVGFNPIGVGVNPTTDRVYVANRLDGTASVIDGASNAVIATVPVGSRPNGVGVHPATNRVYVANSFDDTVSVIDGASNAVIATVPVGDFPVGVRVNPSTDRVYVANHFDDTVSVIDGASNTVVAAVPVGTLPAGVGVNPSTDRVYVANRTDGTVSVIAHPCQQPPPGSTFCDVAADHWAHPFIEATVDAGITAGCSPSPPLYCPDQSVTRAQMAVFIILALGEAPLTPTGVFDDVPTSHFAAGFIERLAELEITAGCGGGNYCPDQSVTRAQMAVFIILALEETPVTPTGVFDDVPTSHFASGFIEKLAELGITTGCSAEPMLYCPNDPVTRAQMAVFIILALEEAPVTPAGVFDDVPPSYWAAGFIEKLADLGITSGCSAEPMLYCPNDPVTRAQMAVFIVVAWNLLPP